MSVGVPELKISYRSETPKDYAEAIDKAENADALRAAIDKFGHLASDAAEAARTMDAPDFLAWQRGLRQERKGKFAGEIFMVKWGAVLLPWPMMRVAAIANTYGVPFGLAYLRLKETNQLDAVLGGER